MNIKSLTIYCSSSNYLPTNYYDLCNDIGKFLGEKKITIVYGGGKSGLMGKIANSAFKNGSKVIGIMPKFLAKKEKINFDISKTIIVDNMSERKKELFNRGDAFLILPGGSGTIEEATEIISWHILGLHQKHIIIFNWNNYWKSLITLYDNSIKNNFGNKNLQSFCKIVKNFQEFKLLFN